MKALMIAAVLLASMHGHGQSADYDNWIKKADSLLQIKRYAEAGKAYSNAFQTIHWKAYPEDRYKAAIARSQAHQPDSAFSQLFKLATRSKFAEVDRLKSEVGFQQIQNDRRWQSLMTLVGSNRSKLDVIKENPITQQLENIYDEDQKYRSMSDWTQVVRADSINKIAVVKILDTHGWLSEDQIGKKANEALFLVVQHSDLATQEKYLPMMRRAVNEKKAKAFDLALLEDRVLMRQKKKQLYGSQIIKSENGNWVVYPIDDPTNVDARRFKMGLGPIAEYLSHMGLTWSIEEHIKQSESK
jgi:hypothetical protein